jgi:hypothetical protein
VIFFSSSFSSSFSFFCLFCFALFLNFLCLSQMNKIERLSNAELIAEFKKYELECGPITATTRPFLNEKLAKVIAGHSAVAPEPVKPRVSSGRKSFGSMDSLDGETTAKSSPEPAAKSAAKRKSTGGKKEEVKVSTTQ